MLYSNFCPSNWEWAGLWSWGFTYNWRSPENCVERGRGRHHKWDLYPVTPAIPIPLLPGFIRPLKCVALPVQICKRYTFIIKRSCPWFPLHSFPFLIFFFHNSIFISIIDHMWQVTTKGTVCRFLKIMGFLHYLKDNKTSFLMIPNS